MSKLKEYLELCKSEYYKGSPIISDSQYDILEEVCSEDLSIGTNKGRVKHWYKMYSLQKYYEDEVLPKDMDLYYRTPKLDGASLSIRYLNGRIYNCVTRGDGFYGENVAPLIVIPNLIKLGIPIDISYREPIQITGEVITPKSIPNARNYAAGALNLDDPIEFSNRDITFFAYDMQETCNLLYESTLDTLNGFGFKTINQITNEYPQDGQVYRLNNNRQYKDWGFTNKHPRGAFALKKRSVGIKTTILDVIWQVGKSGKVTPIAILETINIDGAKVSRATLNNPGFIESLGIQIGDSVMVERAGGIIPRIIKKAE